MNHLEDPPVGAGFDAILSEVLSQVDDVLHEQVRLRLLVDAINSLTGDGTLDGVLAGIVETAQRLVDSRGAAIAVFGATDRLATFERSGLDPALDGALSRISADPGVRGHLTLATDPLDTEALLAAAASPERASGPLAGAQVVAVPVRTRSEVVGLLCVVDRVGRSDGSAGTALTGGFTDTDCSLLVALATAAGVAIENTRLLEAARRRQAWLEATTDVVALLASAEPDAATLRAVAGRAQEAAGADAAWIVVGRDRGSLRVGAMSGLEPDAVRAVIGVDPTRVGGVDLGATLAAEAIETGEPVIVDDLFDEPRLPVVPDAARMLDLRNAAVVPLATAAGVHGALGLGWSASRPGNPTLDEQAQIVAFAEQCALALHVAGSRAEKARLMVFEDRNRIGSILHELVIQQLFGIGLGLESAARLGDRAETAARLEKAVDDIDVVIRDLRRSIFALDDPAGGSTDDGAPMA